MNALIRSMADALGRAPTAAKMVLALLVLGSTLATSPVRAQQATLGGVNRHDYLKYYSDGAGGSFSMRDVDIRGNLVPVNNALIQDNITAVRIYYIGIGEAANSVAPGQWLDKQWSAHAEKAKLTAYRVEVDVYRWVRIGKGWVPSGPYTLQTSRYNWNQ